MGLTRSGLPALQELLDAAVANGLPGISAAVVSGGKMVWLGTAGVADLRTGAPVNPQSIFGIGSITKTFVAIVILQLVEEQRLGLDDKIIDWLPDVASGIANVEQATVAGLLNHTAGVPSWEDEPNWIRAGRGAALEVERIWPKTSTLAYVKGVAADAPGEVRYSNTGFTLLGLLIEKVTGATAEAEIRRRVVTPLGLQSTFFEGFEPAPADRIAGRYHWATAQFRRQAGVNRAFAEVRDELIDVSRSNLSVEWTAGGMMSTAPDLAVFAAALRDGRLLNASSMDFMTRWTPMNDAIGMGHNLMRTQYPDGVAVIGHDGGVLGFSASLYWIEDADVVVAVLCNAGSMHSGTAARSLCLVGKQPEFVALARLNASASAKLG